MFDGLFARGRVSAFEPGYGDGLAGRPEDLKLAPLEVVRVDREPLAQLPAEEVLSDPTFAEDFQYLYRYYKQTVFVKFMVIGPNLYMGMRIGKEVEDLKTFKWLINGDGTLEYLGNRFDHEFHDNTGLNLPRCAQRTTTVHSKHHRDAPKAQPRCNHNSTVFANRAPQYKFGPFGHTIMSMDYSKKCDA